MTHFAGYIRVSKEEPTGGFSLDAQERAIKAWVAARGGSLVHLYTDESQSGRTTERPAFQQMRRDAAAHKFDALVVNKFDRLHRNRKDSLAFKSLLRYDYGIAVYSITEPSEETDGDIGMFVEGLMESVAEWYLHNLSEDMSKAKRERSRQGYQNNQAPFGMTKNANKVLIPDENELPGLQMAFGAYATGEYSDGDIARMLNDAGYTLKNGNRFSKDTVREMLQSRVYIGKVQYRPHIRHEDGREDRRRSAGLEWYDGQHKAVISQALFEQCLAVRAERSHDFTGRSGHKPNRVKGLVYCHRCSVHPPTNVEKFRSWGRMRVVGASGKSKIPHLRCTARDYGVECPQRYVLLAKVEAQVIDSLTHIQLPIEQQEFFADRLSKQFEDEVFQKRIDQLHQLIDEVDFQWDNGFAVRPEDYVAKRQKLRELVLASKNSQGHSGSSTFSGFETYWELCEDDIQKQTELITLFVEKVFVRDQEVVEIVLNGGYQLQI